MRKLYIGAVVVLALAGLVAMWAVFSHASKRRDSGWEETLARADEVSRQNQELIDRIERERSEPPALELADWNWRIESGYAQAEGLVENISDEGLENVVAVVTFFTASDEFITSADALIDYRPILPGQTSPFRVMAPENPAMKTARLDFREFGGASIPWRR